MMSQLNSYNFLKRNVNSNMSFSKKVGVVLPLKGEGLEITNAFLKGLLEANQSSQSNDKIQFIVIDNFSDPILTVEAFKNLVNKHNVSAIIGPFLDKKGTKWSFIITGIIILLSIIIYFLFMK